MSCRDMEGKTPPEDDDTGNVVQLLPTGDNGVRARFPSIHDLALGPGPDAITRDGLDLLKAFFAIDDAAARAALVLMAQRLAQHSNK